MSEIITYHSILKAIGNGLRTTPDVTRVEDYDELSEGVPDLPLVQVYLDSIETDVRSSNTGQSTFGAGVRVSKMTVILDGFARQRSHLNEDSRAQVALMDAIDNQLVLQTQKPFFGIPAIQQFKWSASIVVHVRGDQEIRYAGVRFTLDVTLF